MSTKGAKHTPESFDPHTRHTAITIDREKEKKKKDKEKVKKSTTDKDDIDDLTEAVGSMHLEPTASEEEIDIQLAKLRELVRQHHETALTLNAQGSQLGRIDDKQEHIRENVTEADHQVDEINSGCLSFIKCIFPCCFSCCSKCCTHNHEHQHEMEHTVHHPAPQAITFASAEQLKTRTAKLREMAKLADYLKTESQLESKELDDQNHELDAMHGRIATTTDEAQKVDKKAKKAIKSNQ